MSKAVENRQKHAFGVPVYFAICHQCRGWVKSSIGQFCWLERAHRNRVSRAHRLGHGRG